MFSSICFFASAALVVELRKRRRRPGVASRVRQRLPRREALHRRRSRRRPAHGPCHRCDVPQCQIRAGGERALGRCVHAQPAAAMRVAAFLSPSCIALYFRWRWSPEIASVALEAAGAVLRMYSHELGHVIHPVACDCTLQSVQPAAS
eukprot:6178800-Pleurochrysis_carterae.AAC.2